MLHHLLKLFFLLFISNVVKPARLLIVILLMTSGQSQAQNKTIDSLQRLFQKDKPDTNKVIHSTKLAFEYHIIGNSTTALQYANGALQLARQLNFKKGIITAHLHIGVIYTSLSDYGKAMENYRVALKISEETGNKIKIAQSYNDIGITYFDQGSYDKALENYLAALKIGEGIGDKKVIASAYINMGNVYSSQGRYDKALENYRSSLKIQEEIGDKVKIALSFNNIGCAYEDKGNNDKALENYFSSLKISKEIGNKRWIAGSYQNIGGIYQKQGRYDEALENYLASLKISEEIGDKARISSVDISIGQVYTDKLNYNAAFVWFQKGQLLAKEIGSLWFLQDAYKGLSEVSEKMSDYRNAYDYQKLYSKFKDSIFNEKSNKQTAEMQTKYETEKKEKENKLLVQQNMLQEAKIERRTLILVLLLGLFLFAIGIFAFIYTRYKLKQKELLELALNHQQKLRFKAIIDAEEKERKRVAQELHDGLGQLLSTAKLNVSALEDVLFSNETSVKNALSLIDNAIDEVRTISHNMMPGALIRLGLTSALRDLVRIINNSNKIKAELNVDYDERLNDVNEVAIYRIIQESVNNMIKYSEASHIKIILRKNKADLFIEIKDNGIGFDTSLIETGSGMGWKNIYARTALLNGNIQVTSVASQGTSVNIGIQNIFFEKESFMALNDEQRR